MEKSGSIETPLKKAVVDGDFQSVESLLLEGQLEKEFPIQGKGEFRKKPLGIKSVLDYAAKEKVKTNFIEEFLSKLKEIEPTALLCHYIYAEDKENLSKLLESNFKMSFIEAARHFITFAESEKIPYNEQFVSLERLGALHPSGLYVLTKDLLRSLIEIGHDQLLVALLGKYNLETIDNETLIALSKMAALAGCYSASSLLRNKTSN